MYKRKASVYVFYMRNLSVKVPGYTVSKARILLTNGNGDHIIFLVRSGIVIIVCSRWVSLIGSILQ